MVTLETLGNNITACACTANADAAHEWSQKHQDGIKERFSSFISCLLLLFIQITHPNDRGFHSRRARIVVIVSKGSLLTLSSSNR